MKEIFPYPHGFDIERSMQGGDTKRTLVRLLDSYAQH